MYEYGKGVKQDYTEVISKVDAGGVLGTGADTENDYRVGDVVNYTITIT